jgi:hypothetical protein
LPLKRGKKNIGRNIDEMAHSPNHAKRVSKFGAKKAHEIEVAASTRAAVDKKPKKSAPKRNPTNRRKRNIGRS